MAGDAPEYGTCNRYDGHAHDARLVVMKVFNSMGMWGAGFDFYSVYEKAQQSGAHINNNSWGGPASQLDDPYGMVGHDADRFVADHPDQIMVMAAGNFGEEGRGSIATPGNAKNVLAVGAVLTDQPDSIAPFSSRGPTHDGRIKPDVVAPGGPISSAEADTVDGYVAHQGTSMAAPAVSGAAALVRQYYTDGYYPTGAPQPAAGFTPSAALVKATLINGTGEVTGRDSDAYGEGYPNNAQGWGRIDLDSSLHLQGDEGCMRVWDGPEALSSGTGWQETVAVVDGSRELRVHLVWTDPAPAQGADRILVNDLDLQLTTPDGTVYLGNNFTSSNPGYSVPAGEADSVNNVEGIRLVPGHSFSGDLPSGTWSVRVLGANVPDGPQDFALVISGGIK